MSNITSQTIVDYFNTIINVDPSSLGTLFKLRVGCNAALADHPTVVCFSEGEYVGVGIVGVLNGLLMACGQPKIVLITDVETGEMLKFDIYKEDS